MQHGSDWWVLMAERWCRSLRQSPRTQANLEAGLPFIARFLIVGARTAPSARIAARPQDRLRLGPIHVLPTNRADLVCDRPHRAAARTAPAGLRPLPAGEDPGDQSH